MRRPLSVVVDAGAMRHNLDRVRALAPGCRCMAVVKAEAYGHGIARAVRALDGVDAFGVCCLEEALQVRETAPHSTVVLLEGCLSAAEFAEVARLGLETVVHHAEQLAMLESERPALRVWLKVDTGMHRLGFAPAEVATAWARLQAAVPGAHRLMTHLAAVENAAFTAGQLECFHQATAGLQAERSIANSAALLSLPEVAMDWVRPGLMLYGASPLPGDQGQAHGLRPAMSLCSELIAVHELRRGDRVGYGAAWECPADLRVGIVAAGYGDGYPRNAASGTPVLVAGRPARLIAPPSMDMLAVQLDQVPEARPGDPVLLWGPELPVETVAASAGTIPHQLLSGITSRVAIREHGAD